MANLSADDQARVKALSDQYNRQKASGADSGVLDAIHAQAEAIRAQYGYSGGADGSTYIPVSTTGVTKSALQTSASQQDYITAMYKAQQAQRLAALNTAYEENVNTLSTAAAAIPETYNTARDKTAASAEQSRAAFNERAVSAGLNSGTGGQAELAMRNTLAGNLSALDRQQAASTSELAAQRTQLATDYNNAIAQAVSESDLARAQALYTEAVRVDDSLVSSSQSQVSFDQQYQQYQNRLAQSSAEALAASTGDFSGYKAAFGWTDAQQAAAEAQWKKQNPLLAMR